MNYLGICTYIDEGKKDSSWNKFRLEITIETLCCSVILPDESFDESLLSLPSLRFEFAGETFELDSPTYMIHIITITIIIIIIIIINILVKHIILAQIYCYQ